MRFSLLVSDCVSGWKLAVHQLDDDPAPSKSFSTELCSSSSVRERKKKKNPTHWRFSSIICAELERTFGPRSPQQCHSEARQSMNKNDSYVLCLGEKRAGWNVETSTFLSLKKGKRQGKARKTRQKLI